MKLATCYPLIIQWANEIVASYDCHVITGHRGMIEQNRAFADKKSKVRWPNSRHNSNPSMAIDIGPWIPGRGVPWPQYPSNWNNVSEVKKYLDDLNQWYHFAGYGLRTAEDLGIQMRWGGDWDRDKYVGDNGFDDLAHWEIVT